MGILLNEKDYVVQMTDTVEPFLARRETWLQLEREKNCTISCMRYLADEPEGSILIIHGYKGAAEQFKEVTYYFVMAGYHVYAMDLCGHGRSYRLVEDLSLIHVDSYMRYVKDTMYVAHYCKEEHPQLPLYVFGHSLGGALAVAAASIEQDIFSKMMLSSPMIRLSTGMIPWKMMEQVIYMTCEDGGDKDYVLGQHPFTGEEFFEESEAVSRPRYEYYWQKRKVDELLQMTGYSYGWLREMFRLDEYLHNGAWKTVIVPMIVFQAAGEYRVSKSEQERFVEKVRQSGNVNVEIAHFTKSKHEIFNAAPETIEKYWKRMFEFLGNTSVEAAY